MADDQTEDIDLSALGDDELAEQMHNDLYDGMKNEIVEGTKLLLGRGWTASRVLDDALVAGMKIVGIDFRDGILFVPEVLLAANAMKAGMEILRPLLAETGAELPRIRSLGYGRCRLAAVRAVGAVLSGRPVRPGHRRDPTRSHGAHDRRQRP